MNLWRGILGGFLRLRPVRARATHSPSKFTSVVWVLGAKIALQGSVLDQNKKVGLPFLLPMPQCCRTCWRGRNVLEHFECWFFHAQPKEPRSDTGTGRVLVQVLQPKMLQCPNFSLLGFSQSARSS